MDVYRDIQIEQLEMDPRTRQGIAVVRLTLTDPGSPDWLQEGELVEIIEGFKVVAVGRITAGKIESSGTPAHSRRE
jgi:hypothetical protein